MEMTNIWIMHITLVIIVFVTHYIHLKEKKKIKSSLLIELTRNDTYKLYLDYCVLIKESPSSIMISMIKERTTYEMLIEFQQLVLNGISEFTEKLKNQKQ